MCLPVKTAAAGCQCNAALTSPFLERYIYLYCPMTPIEGRERKKCGGKVHPLVGLVAIAVPGMFQGRFSHALCPQLSFLLLTLTPRPKKLRTSDLILYHLLLWA